jgi:hypothetical protein
MAELNPEERGYIYEEEKARKEAQDRLKNEEKAKTAKRVRIGCLGLLGLIVGIAAIGYMLSPTETTRRSRSLLYVPAPTPLNDNPKLSLISSTGTISEYGYSYVEGEVRNISNEPLQHVTAVASWYDASDTFITSDSALIEYDPLLPGQTSPFKVGTRNNPAIKRFSIGFKTMLGGSILRENAVEKDGKKAEAPKKK